MMLRALARRSTPSPISRHRTTLWQWANLATRVPRSCAWSALPLGERAAWEALGWGEASWNGEHTAPLSTLKTWHELSNLEKAAAQNALQYTPDTWETHMDELASHELVVQQDDEPAAPPATSGAGRASNFASTVWGAAQALAPAVGSALKQSRHPAASLAGHVLEGLGTAVDNYSDPIVVDGLETTLYLDDSGSMSMALRHNFTIDAWWSGKHVRRLDEGRRVVASLAPLLEGPTRIVKFGERPTVIQPRDPSGQALSDALMIPRGGAQGNALDLRALPFLMSWDASSGGTYMWHMIEQDVLERYRPGGGKLRLVVVTDGEDVLSPPGYNGVRGMDPMQRTLLKAGYDIEWHIIVLGEVPGSDRYAALAGATGGSFLAISDSFDESRRDVQSFLDAIDQGSDGAARYERQRRYELEANKGDAERVEWFQALPPPDRK